MMKRIFLSLLIFISLHAVADDCYHLLSDVLKDVVDNQNVEVNRHIDTRHFLTRFLKDKGIPGFLKKSPAGEDLPVILVNGETAPKLDGLISNSYGTQVVLQPDWNNDHGLMRIANNIIDVDLPGHRGFGELHQTGLAWKPFQSYMARRQQGSSVILEVLYLLNPDEKRAIDFYQRVRRSAIFRVKFTFGGARNNPDPFLLQNGGEHCFIFCKAGGVSSHVSEITSKLREFSLDNPNEYLRRDDIKEAMDVIMKKVEQTDANNISHHVLDDPDIHRLFNQKYPFTENDPEKQKTFLRWLVSYHASNEYSKVLKDLGVTSDFGLSDTRNPRATALLVYDSSANASEFAKANYSTNGKFTSWPATEQKAIPDNQ